MSSYTCVVVYPCLYLIYHNTHKSEKLFLISFAIREPKRGPIGFVHKSDVYNMSMGILALILNGLSMDVIGQTCGQAHSNPKYYHQSINVRQIKETLHAA